jgi:hypothetical protein
VQAITAMEELAREMMAVRSADDGHYRRCDAAPLLGLYIQKHLGAHVGLSERSRDPRFGRPLEMLVRDRLAPFLPAPLADELRLGGLLASFMPLPPYKAACS